MKSSQTQWMANAVALVVLAIIALAAVVPVALRGLELSVYDEPTHIDYAYQLAHGTIPATGDFIAEEVREAWSCYGTQYYEAPNCTIGAPASDYPNEGYQYNAWHPPVYYAVTAVVGSAVQWATGLDFVTSYRMTGALWMFAGMAMMMFALRNLGVDRWLASSLAAVAGLWWASIVSSVNVTNDAPGLLIGASALLIIGHIARGTVPWPWMIALGAFAASTKVMSSLGVLALAGACIVVALVPGWKPPGVARWRLILGGVGTVAAVAAVYIGWEKFQSTRDDPNWVNPLTSGVEIVGSPIDEWASTFFDGFLVIGHTLVDFRVASGPLVLAIIPLVGCALVAALAAGIVRAQRFSAMRMIVIAAAAGMLVWPMIVQIQVFGSREEPIYFPDPTGRYGYTVLILLFGALAMLPQRIATQRLLTAASVIYVLAMLISLWLGGER